MADRGTRPWPYGSPPSWGHRPCAATPLLASPLGFFLVPPPYLRPLLPSAAHACFFDAAANARGAAAAAGRRPAVMAEGGPSGGGGDDASLPLFSTLLLAGDVGGTNARLSADYPSFSSVISAFLLEAGAALPGLLRLTPRAAGGRPLPLGGLAAAAFAVAGPVEGGRINFTNREGWILDSAGLADEFGIPSVELVNDFVANGYGVLTLSPEEVVLVQDGKAVRGGVIALIGAGTGLGQCFLTAGGAGGGDGEYTAWGSEGGHVDWAPTTAVQGRLLRFLHKRFGSSFEADGGVTPLSPAELADAAAPSVAADASAAAAAAAAATGGGAPPPPPPPPTRRTPPPPPHLGRARRSILASAEPGRAIAAGAYNCALCARTMDLFFDAYATAVGNVALTYLPTGGLYVAGGIAPKNMEYITADAWGRALRRKGRLSGVVGGMRVAVVVKEDLGLRGAHIVATRLWGRFVRRGGEGENAAGAPPPVSSGEGGREAASAAAAAAVKAGGDPAGGGGTYVALSPWAAVMVTSPAAYTAAAVAAGAAAVAAVVTAARPH
ncbi:hypothetical protein BU14_0154s0029 [Porphyra umbilicalis]|uniref:Glucokinase n=1 Tax=Porphyra umbilicalis TaxID=2786 RepID=A0A1X6P8N3_PORUM|nr:hypothetical protein BU14_0154s0029 [Porphyra umbilicalis]|eukprot:OSX77252.1 hypothetical protein BU14_0154s0029 [Porphyra umbilicalis]